MGFLDSIIAALSPQAAYKREAFRQAYDWLRNYDAGNFDRPNQNWRVSNQSADVTDRYSRDDVKARARDLERNSDIMNSVSGAFKRNVVGGGFRVQAKTEETDLNKDGSAGARNRTATSPVGRASTRSSAWRWSARRSTAGSSL